MPPKNNQPKIIFRDDRIYSINDIPVSLFTVITAPVGEGKSQLLSNIAKLPAMLGRSSRSKIIQRQPDQALGSIGPCKQIPFAAQLGGGEWVLNSYKAFVKTQDFVTSVPFNSLQSLLFPCLTDCPAVAQSLLTEINSVLILYKFKYVIDDNIPCNFRFDTLNFVNQLLDASDPAYRYPYEKLSSGEKSMLDFLIWVYCARLGVFDNTVLVLDEPDKYLDPKSCKILFQIIDKEFLGRGIQIIMSSHRLDTIALMHETEHSKVFRVKRDDQGVPAISSTTKLQALFRLTHNLRAMVNLHTKVYVEAHNDARFYSSIYSILMDRCSDIKEAYRGSRIPDQNPHFLSRRYQLGFYSVAIDANGGGGGCDTVEKMLKCDIASRELCLKLCSKDTIETTFDNWLEKAALSITKPFGILDRDYRQHSPVRYRFLPLKRHSLENFLFDPFIVISLLDDIGKITDLEIRNICADLISCIILYDFPNGTFVHFITNSNAQMCARPFDRAYFLQTLVDRYFLALLSRAHDRYRHSRWTDEDIQEKSWRFSGAKDDLNKGERIAAALALIIEEKANTVDLYVGYNRIEHFSQLIREKWSFEGTEIEASDNKRFNMVCDHLVKPERVVQYRRIEDVKAGSSSLHSFGHKTIRVMVDKNRSSMLEVQYPLLFLELRGHDIEYVFPISISSQKKENKKRDEFKNHLLDNLFVHKEIIVPLDLAEIFFRIDIRLRNQACKNAEILETDIEIKDDIIISSLTNTSMDQGVVVSGTFCTKPSATLWSRYHITGLNQLLSLRLVGIDIAVCNAIIIDEHMITSPISLIEDSLTVVIPLVYLSTSKPAHAVGLILERMGGVDSTALLYQTTYIDPENNPISTAVIQIITSSLPDNAHISFEQRLVEEQLYSNNCGPKLIEDLYEAVSGKKGVAQHLISYSHSELLERALYTEAGYVTRNIPLTTSRDLDSSTALILRAILCISDLTQYSFTDKINILVGINRWILAQLKNVIVHHKDLTDCRTSRYGINMRISDELRKKDLRSALLDKGDLSSDFVLEDAGTLLDLIRLYQAPKLNNANHVATCALRLYSIHSCSPLAVAVSTVDDVSAVSAKI